MEVAFLVELFEANDDFGEYFGGLVEGEDAVLEFGLVVDEVAAVAVLEDEVDVGFVFGDVVELDDVGRVHGLHALDFAVQILAQMRLVLDHADGDEFERQQLPLLVLHQIHVPVGSLPQPPLVLVPVQKHKILYVLKSNSPFPRTPKRTQI